MLRTYCIRPYMMDIIPAFRGGYQHVSQKAAFIVICPPWGLKSSCCPFSLTIVSNGLPSWVACIRFSPVTTIVRQPLYRLLSVMSGTIVVSRNGFTTIVPSGCLTASSLSAFHSFELVKTSDKVPTHILCLNESTWLKCRHSIAESVKWS